MTAVALPKASEEAWKYTPVAEIEAARRAAVPAADESVTRTTLDDLAGDLGCPRLVFVNGRASRDLSDRVPAGVRIGAVPSAATLMIAADVDVETPLHIVHVSVPRDLRSLSHPRSLVHAAPGSHVAVVETYCGSPGPALTEASTEIRVGSAARVEYVRIQVEPDDAIHIGRTRVEQGEASAVHLTSVTSGGDIARQQIDVRLPGSDARTDLDGLYLPARQQRHDTVVRVDHAASRGTTTQRFKGVVDDHARGSFSGHVIVRPGTTGNDAQQANHNLLLSPTAEADTRPWLEIFADEVRCTHGATVGRLDGDALFYLRSRGIPLSQSRDLLVSGFTAEILDTISLPTAREWLAHGVARRSPERRR